ncbi:hypothetical protein K438DRAFT_1015549 [Mycena galopus ATCC 62051]|nr:hypothetical protein K438DRAFT_1015549 [Mycena galopus ATCC 62051]
MSVREDEDEDEKLSIRASASHTQRRISQARYTYSTPGLGLRRFNSAPPSCPRRKKGYAPLHMNPVLVHARAPSPPLAHLPFHSHSSSLILAVPFPFPAPSPCSTAPDVRTSRHAPRPQSAAHSPQESQEARGGRTPAASSTPTSGARRRTPAPAGSAGTMLELARTCRRVLVLVEIPHTRSTSRPTERMSCPDC